MCFYIANARFSTGADGLPEYAHPEGPQIRVLTPVPFESLSVAEAALRALLVDLEERADPANPDGDLEGAEALRVWGEFPIVLWNSHEPDRHVVYGNLFNSSNETEYPGVAESVEHFTSAQFNRLADERRVEDDNALPASRFTLRSLPRWEDIDIISKYRATVAVEHFISHPEDDLYTDPLTGVSAVESYGPGVFEELQAEMQDEEDARQFPSRRGDPSSLRVRGE
jgi:hypothetical protein